MIGIIGAMQVEVEDLFEKMQDCKTETISGTTFYCGQLSGVPCVVAQSGIGKVAAAVCAQTMILRYAPDVILCEGVAGGIGPNVHIGDLVIATALVQHDMDTSALGDPVGYISGLGMVQIPVPQALANAIATFARDVYDGNLYQGIIATGDQFIADNQKLHEIADKFGAVACEMEGGAIAQTCCMAGVDCAVLRTISDNGDDGASVDFPSFATQVAHKNRDLLMQILPHLARQLEVAS